MKNPTLKKLLLYTNIILLIIHFAVGTGAFLAMNDIAFSITRYIAIPILWPFLLDNVLFVFFLIQAILFSLPIFGIILNRKKYLLVHLGLLFLMIANLYLYFYIMRGFGV